jgi:lipopolysaccharide export LptBFGC system permease protein LptF
MKKFNVLLFISIFALIFNSCVTPISNEGRDGLTLETAWKVKSMQEQYEFVLKKCPGCKPLSQALTVDSSGNMIDVFVVEKPNGAQIKYYFDVSYYF